MGVDVIRPGLGIVFENKRKSGVVPIGAVGDGFDRSPYRQVIVGHRSLGRRAQRLHRVTFQPTGRYSRRRPRDVRRVAHFCAARNSEAHMRVFSDRALWVGCMVGLRGFHKPCLGLSASAFVRRLKRHLQIGWNAEAAEETITEL